MAIYQNLTGGYKMPAVGLGTFTVTDNSILEKALDAAIEAGYRHIDTAFAYQNEAIIGKVLKKWFDSGKLKRENIFITTKLRSDGNHPDRVETFMKKSLEALQLDYVDLYLIHFPVGMDEVDGQRIPIPTDHIAIWKKMEEQVDAGRTKSIGISNFNAKQIDKIWQVARIKPAVLQVELHPYFQQREMVDYCHKRSMAITGYSSLGSSQQQPGKPSVLNNDIIRDIAAKHSKSTAQVVLRYFVQKNIIVIPKSITPSRIKENIDIFDFSLDPDDVKALEQLDQGEDGRFTTFLMFHPKITEHPEYPFKKST